MQWLDAIENDKPSQWCVGDWELSKMFFSFLWKENGSKFIIKYFQFDISAQPSSV